MRSLEPVKVKSPLPDLSSLPFLRFMTKNNDEDELQFAQHPPVRRYPEKSTFAKIDTTLSSFLSHLPLTSVPLLSFIPFLFGHAFGAPVIALVTLPPFLLSDHPYVQLYSLAATVSWLLVYFHTCSRKVLENPTFILVGIVGNIILSLTLNEDTTSSNALDTYCLYLCSWLYSTVLCFLGKTFFLRSRPAFKNWSTACSMLQQQKKQQEKEKDSAPLISSSGSSGGGGGAVLSSERWSPFTEDHTRGENAKHSFPSFDAACSGCYVATLYLQRFGAELPPPWWLFLIIPLASFGRIFFLAHHLFDVVVGAALGISSVCYVKFVRLSSIMATSSDVASAPLLGDTSAGHHYDILWLIICLVSIGLFFAVPKIGPIIAVIFT